jgi:cation diffusion facilitator CzcD-associated flavoprotein CzcO
MAEQFDVLVIGAGLSGIGAAHHLVDAFPNRTYAVLEAREAIGGTWDLFRYPGIRSDSDMHTLGYRFRPWTQAKSIADGPSILQYIRETAREAGIDENVRFGLEVVRAEWSSAAAEWTVTARRADGTESEFLCRFLYNCAGYYSYDSAHTPDFAGLETFGGQVVHPQFWPEDLDYTGKRVVVIGSGATAITLVPAMAEQAAHVTMLQRSPSYVMNLPSRDKIALALHRILGDRTGYALTRWKNVVRQWSVFNLSQRHPDLMRTVIRNLQARQLPKDYPLDVHFDPAYGPWDQRLCAVPDNDLFRVLGSGRASIVTDHIEAFDATGIRLKSGAHLDADIVVTATGLDLQPLGKVEMVVDGVAAPIHEAIAYKGMMLSGVPNFAFTVGYTNSSWTLKADLVAEYVVRVLRRMDRTGHDIAVPINRDADLETRPLLDFKAGYVQRAMDRLPRAGARKPWRLGQNYPSDLITLRHRSLDDAAMTWLRSTDVEQVVPSGHDVVRAP